MTDAQFFGRIQDQYNKNLPFVAYRKPNKDKVCGLLQTNDVLYKTTNFDESGFIFSPFDDREDTVLTPLERSESISMTSIGSSIFEAFHAKEDSTYSQKQQHIDLVKKGIEAIKNSAFQKVVLSRKESVNLKKSDPIEIFKNLLNTYKAAFVYCWYHPKVGLWLGATPETLIKIEGKRFSIMALAGTQDYKGKLDVNWEDKEKQEQQFVTDFIIDNLKPFAEDLKISKTQTVRAGNLLHLKTMISARLKADNNLSKVISSLHPTPAVCGLPKPKTKDFILKYENYSREFYTGFLGELNLDTNIAPRLSKRNIENRAYTITRKSTQLYVNLRCMQLKGQKALIYVGGGITETSNPEKEWIETVSKSLVIKSVL
ncbi:chorismate-binding protein [uncultured Algibacter sp.]|uniref:chorismate-binding protein n=1 Tax=uncultured Algibacter sp. TaxID=298659 RepID=UPI00261BFA7B|nr:chorismate-binding protein [uncultured Algibacter sp.]